MADLQAIIKKHFEPIFKAYDKDQNSTLEKEELRALLADNLGVNEAAITQEQLDWHFGKIDADKDGKITFNEYVNFYLITQFGHFFGERAKNSMKDQNKEGNEDELIDKAEFRKLMEDTFRPLKIQITNEMVDWNFSQIDRDNSGRISFDEYMNFIKKYN